MYADLKKVGVAAAMQKKAGVTLGVALQSAVDLRVIQFNPARMVKKPRHTPKEMKCLDAEQAVAFLADTTVPDGEVVDADSQKVVDAIDRYAALGSAGCGAFSGTHSEQKTRFAYEECTRPGLLTTGSADSHAPDHRLFSRFRAFDLHGLEPNLGPIA